MIDKDYILEEVRTGIYRGFFVIAYDYDGSALKTFSEEILNNSKEHKEIIYLKAEENKSLFQEIRNMPKIEIINNRPVYINTGLSIPQDKPIILVIENFDRLNISNEQYNFSKILNQEENLMDKTFIHPLSIILLSAKKGSKLDIKLGFAIWYSI